MPTITIIAFAVFIMLSLIPLLSEKNRTKWGYISSIGPTIVAVAVFLTVLFLHLNLLIGIGIMILSSFVLDRNTYTKSGLIKLGVIIVVVSSVAYFVLREDLNYVVEHLKTDPSTSFYYAVNDEVIASRNEDMNIPLASTAKMPIAGAFAEEVRAGNMDPNEQVALSELEKFYFPNTDGGAHPDWLEDIDEETVTLEEVVRGMISYSSNANTDYLLQRLGIDYVNERIAAWDLASHDDIYPFVSGLIVMEEYAGELEDLSFEAYKKQVLETHQAIVDDELSANEMRLNVSIGDQRYWSDWLPSSTTEAYSRWLNSVQNGQWADEETSNYFMDILSDNYTAPEGYTIMGGKGGSTAFVLNDSRFLTAENGDTVQWAMFIDDLNMWQRFKLNNNYFAFVQRLLEDNAYQEEVMNELQSSS